MAKETADEKIAQIKQETESLHNRCKLFYSFVFTEDAVFSEAVLKYFSSLYSNKLRRVFIEKLGDFNNLLVDIAKNTGISLGNISNVHRFSLFLCNFFSSAFEQYHPLWFDKHRAIYPQIIDLLLVYARHPEFQMSNPLLSSTQEQDLSLFQVLLRDFSHLGEYEPEIEYEFFKKIAQLPTINFNEQNNCWGNTNLHFLISNAESNHCIRFIKALTIFDEKNHCNLNVNILSRAYGTSALHLVIAKGYRDVDSYGIPVRNFLDLIAVLIEAGADVNLKSASVLGYQEKGVAIKSLDISGEQTPLHIACARRDLEMIDLLMQNHADPSIINEAGLTPIEVLNLSFEQRKIIVDSISGKGLNNFVQYDRTHASEEHFVMCRELLQEKPTSAMSSSI